MSRWPFTRRNDFSASKTALTVQRSAIDPPFQRFTWRVTRNVKRWKGGSMALRWTVSAVLEAEKSFRRVKGHRDMPQLLAALEATLGGKAVDTEAQIA